MPLQLLFAAAAGLFRLLSCHHGHCILCIPGTIDFMLQVAELEVHAQELLIGVPVEGEAPAPCRAAPRATPSLPCFSMPQVRGAVWA